MKNSSRHIKTLLKKSKVSLARMPHRISMQETSRLEEIFKQCDSLKVAYNLKNKLHEILYTRNINHEGFIKTLNEWCDEANSKGIAHLGNFCDSLKGYKVV